MTNEPPPGGEQATTRAKAPGVETTPSVERYGSHLAWCNARNHGSPLAPCTCGLRDAILSAREAQRREATAVELLEQASTALSRAMMFVAGAYVGRGISHEATLADPVYRGFNEPRDAIDAFLASLAGTTQEEVQS